MYKIIGADQREYGPVSADQMRQWIREGRAGAQTSVLAEGGATWQPLATFPEFADELAAKTAATIGGIAAPTVLSEDVFTRDYQLDIGACIGRSWNLFKKNFWPVVGITALILVISAVTNQVLGLISGPATRQMITEQRITVEGALLIFLTSLLYQPLYYVLLGGLYKYYLKLIRGESAGIDDAFSGFTGSFIQLALLGLVAGFLSFIGYCLCVLPGIYLTVAWALAAPLVVDRRLGFWQAMEFSRKMINKHWFIVFGLLVVAGLITLAGVLACCIGVFVTAPIGLIAMMYAYEDIFSAPASKTA